MFKQIIKRSRRKLNIYKEKYYQEFIFIHINKTAGSSIEKALKLKFEHKTAMEKISEIGINRWNNKYTFTIVRNPWDKVVSHYHYRVRTNQTNLAINPITFKEWVIRAYRDCDPEYRDKEIMFQPQLDWITNNDGKIMVNYIGRFENLQQDFLYICKKINRTASLEHVKKSSHRNYCDYYDHETRDIISRCFEKDIEEFEYQYDADSSH